MTVEGAYDILFTAVLGVLGVLALLCLLRSIIGPRIADRVVAVNMVGTNTIIVISVLSVALGEAYLIDISLIYAMISFLAVVLLTKVYIGAYRESKLKKDEGGGGDERVG